MRTRDAMASELQGRVVAEDDTEWTMKELLFIQGMAASIERSSETDQDRYRAKLLKDINMGEGEATLLEMRPEYPRALVSACIPHLARGITSFFRSIRRKFMAGELPEGKFSLELMRALGYRSEVEMEQKVRLGDGRTITYREIKALSDSELDAAIQAAGGALEVTARVQADPNPLAPQLPELPATPSE